MKHKHRKFNLFYVYKIVAESNPDEILYIGQTAVPHTRLRFHYYNKKGLFYMRTDIRLEVIEIHQSRYDVKMAEHQLQKTIWPDRESDLEKNIKGCKRGGDNPQKWGRAKGGSIGGKTGGKTSSNRMYHMSCGRSIKTNGAMIWHQKKCGCEVLHWYQIDSSTS
jgi:predicted GIY-YIG superfamily endonuclease